jgi:hypothetical protein
MRHCNICHTDHPVDASGVDYHGCGGSWTPCSPSCAKPCECSLGHFSTSCPRHGDPARMTRAGGSEPISNWVTMGSGRRHA